MGGRRESAGRVVLLGALPGDCDEVGEGVFVEFGPKVSSPASELVVEDPGGESFEVANVVGREDAIQQRTASVTA
jgi:hypothetical protein